MTHLNVTTHHAHLFRSLCNRCWCCCWRVKFKRNKIRAFSRAEWRSRAQRFVPTTFGDNAGWRKKNASFSNNCNFVYFQYKKIPSTPKQLVINAVLINYINYWITENYIGKMASSFLPYTRPEPRLKVLHHIYLPAISFFGVTSNQKSAFENLVQSTIWKFPFAKKLKLCHKKY